MAGIDVKTQSINESKPPVKKQKLTDEENGDLVDLSTFHADRILNCDSEAKYIATVGKFGDSDEHAVVVLEKKAFDAENFGKLCTRDTVFKKVFRNDVYGNYDCFIPSDLNGVKATVICPASDKHIQKFERQEFSLVEETADVYQSVTLPYLEKEALSLQWVYNILDHKSEVDRIVLEDPDPCIGFVLLPDLKWDGENLNSLYLLALVRPIGIKSIRDLTEEHLPLLENIYKKCIDVIKERYKLPPSKIRAFLHYQPTFYHLHIHFTYLGYKAPGIETERAHLLSTVINNINLVPNYYQVVTLPFKVKHSDKLFSVLEDRGLLK